MRVLFWLILVAPLSVGCGGEGTSKTAVIEKECLAFCEDLSNYFTRCESQGEHGSCGVQADVYEGCSRSCSDWTDSADEGGCEDEYEAYVDCLNTPTWSTVECTEEAIESAMTPCWNSEDDFYECVRSSEGAADDTGPVDTGGWE